MVTTKSVKWNEISGFSKLSSSTKNDLLSNCEILDTFILRDKFNPTNIDSYISMSEKLIYLIYYNDNDRIELVRTLEDTIDNREYTIMKLS